jgi:Ca2+-transporting ATPase
LDSGAVAARLRRDGPNELGLNQRRTLANVAAEVAREPMFLLLLGAGAIYLVMGDARDASILLGFVLIIMAVTIAQERRTDNVLETLRDLSSPRAVAIRGGMATRIAGRDVVVDDLLILNEGDRIAADGELVETHELAVDESMLTGESLAVAKQAAKDRVFAGTLVVSGQGMMRVRAIGAHTELGQIGLSLKDVGMAVSPLRVEVAALTRKLLVIGIALCGALFFLFWMLRGGLLNALLSGITLAMAILPQEFPVIMIAFFSLGARRLAASQVLTRRLGAIETLGETTVLCVDKTGTLTQNRMEVAVLLANGQELTARAMADGGLPTPFQDLARCLALASEIDPHDAMEKAFHRLATDHLGKAAQWHSGWRLAREYELSAELMAMSHLWDTGEGQDALVASKGAPEAVAELCRLPDAQMKQVCAQASDLAGRGLRVLAVAKAVHPARVPWPQNQREFDFRFVGLVGLADPLRPQAPEAIARCRAAGIRVVMITGDHPQTARAIAAQAGINASQVLTGADLRVMPPQMLVQRVGEVDVFARVLPNQKLMLVNTLKARGEVVAMTGDGVNDAPALKAAHIGIAMGRRGTDVAREAAALVLLEDDFSAIVAAIALGRRIFANLRQAMIYTLAVHVPILGMSVLPVLFGWPLLLAPLHIAFLELVIDPACSIAFEGQEQPGLMAQPPRAASERLLFSGQIVQAMGLGSLITLLVGGLYAGALVQVSEADWARTVAFIALIGANVALILATRTTLANWSGLGKGVQATTWWVLAGTMGALVLVTWAPGISSAFGFALLPAGAWGGALAIGLAMVVPFHYVNAMGSRRLKYG